MLPGSNGLVENINNCELYAMKKGLWLNNREGYFFRATMQDKSVCFLRFYGNYYLCTHILLFNP
jgi:hypothetical protein